MKKQQLLLVSLLAGTLILLWATVVQAQTLDKRWIGPRLLSNPGVEQVGQAVMIPDKYGYLHVFWSEVDPDDEINTIQYARFDGELWEGPIDIFMAAPGSTISAYSASLDETGDRIYLMWNEGNTGPVFLSSASVLHATSAHNWERPLRFNFPAFQLGLRIDSKGVMHLMYNNFYGAEPGIYYTSSKDRGLTWSAPLWIDPDIPVNSSPNVLKFYIDEQDGLHASWYYAALDAADVWGQWIRYSHSLDGGETWISPITIDEADETPDELRIPYPGMIVAGNSVHMIWAGNNKTQREHRYSLDRGNTWSETTRVFGGLQGQALGDGLAVDGAGRVHFFGQIRWPQGVYHAVWDGELGWSEPEIVYLIARDSAEGRNGRYHAHAVRAAVRAGNQLVVTFTDEAVGPMYVMYTTLEDVPPDSVLPTPTPTSLPMEATPTTAVSTPEPTRTPLVGVQPSQATSANVGSGFWLGVVPPTLLVTLIFLYRFFRSRRRH